MGTQGIGTFLVNSKWSSGTLIFYEKAVGMTTTGNIFAVGTTAVKVGDTANDIDFQFYGTGSISAIIDCGDSSFTLAGINISTNAQIAVTDTTDASSLTTGSITTAGGVSIAKQLYLGDDIDMSVSGTGVYDITLKDSVADALSIVRGTTDMMVFNSSAPSITITPATTITGLITASAGLSDDGTTDTTSGTSGSIHTDGGIGIAKSLYVGTGVTVNNSTIGLNFDGTLNQGINFDDATLNIASAMGRNRCFIGVGTYGDHLSLNLSAADQSGDRCYLTQLFVDSTANPGHTNMYLQGAYYRINVTTIDQTNLSVGGMCPTLDIDYDVKNAYALKAELDMSATGLAVGQNAFAVSGYLEVATSGNLDVSGSSGAAAVTADFAGGTGLTLTGTSRTFALKGNVYSGATATGVICCRVDGSGIVTDGISIECGATATMTNALAFNALGGMTYFCDFESVAGFLSTASDSTDCTYELAVNVAGVAKYIHLFDT